MKGKLKWIILSIIAIVAIIVSVAIIVINELQLQYTIEEIKEYNYFILTKDSKYGVIDKNGNVVVEPNYIAVQIPNPSKPIFVCIIDYNQETNEYTTVVFNDNKQEIYTDYKNVRAINMNTNTDANPYEKSVLLYEQENKYGLITLEGKPITKPIYDEISSINYKEGTFLVKKDGKAGAINMKGKVVIRPEYETITSDNYYNEATKNKTTGFIVSKRTENGYRYGYINYRGKIILDTEYTELERVTQIQNDNELYFIAFKDGQAGLLKNKKLILNYQYEDIQYHSLSDLFIVERNGKQGVVAKDGSIILASDYDNILFGGIYLSAKKGDKIIMFDKQGHEVQTNAVSMSQTDNPNYYISIDENEIYTVTDANGNILIDGNYTYIEYLPGNYFIVAKDGKNGIINSKGDTVVELKYTSIFRFNDTNLLQAEIIDSKTIELYTISEMKKVASMQNAAIKEYKQTKINPNKYIMLASETDFKYYDENGNELDAKTVFPENNLLAKKVDNEWVFVDREENVKVKNNYEMLTNFNEYGYAGIKKDGKWGVINTSGEIICEPTYKLSWVQPSFLGKYYCTKVWYDYETYSSDEI